ncbi:hypothetical protein HWQ46_05670 [Shewanella sp. D64]|uniref:hypothetical protein n=1 Tax=unclassified Shewanella TaxID=196818 RepID=UPI0022BA2E9B|nr:MULTISPECIES: hypothetical protein [unclassified Shewanella]MEC4725040.1 hypothetical protein [Shewanella sp. D64]MEC4736941.1 hypothetical protein [Shewanella sp. E94]WBJ96536.1 hypothetical protein HWQ47_05275 [Shewanella sp. MTB7]
MDINKSSNKKDNKQYFFDNPKNIKWVMNIFYACCVLVVVLDFVINRHVYHSWENFPLFYPIYGFVGCVILVLIARWMRTFLMRPEDYYDKQYDDYRDSNDDIPSNNNSENVLENAADENTHKGRTVQAKNNNIGDHDVDA